MLLTVYRCAVKVLSLQVLLTEYATADRSCRHLLWTQAILQKTWNEGKKGKGKQILSVLYACDMYCNWPPTDENYSAVHDCRPISHPRYLTSTPSGPDNMDPPTSDEIPDPPFLKKSP